MTTLLYFTVALLTAVFSLRAWWSDRQEPARLAFLGVGCTVSIAYFSFALSLIPGLIGFRILYMAAGGFVPAFALWCVDRLFRPDSPPSVYVGRLFLASAIVLPPSLAWHAIAYFDLDKRSPPGIAAGIFTCAAFLFAIYRLWVVYDQTDLRVDRLRMRYLLGMTIGAVGMTAVEQIVRTVEAPFVTESVPLAMRGVILQGSVPPISVLLTGLAIYFLHHTLVMSRLLDMHELFSRGASLVFSALMLVLVDGITVVWFGTFTDHPLHGTFQIFLGSLAFLAAYEPSKRSITWWSNRLFNQRGQQLAEAMISLRKTLRTITSQESLSDLLLSRLHASGRVPICSVYLWDAKVQAFTCTGHRGFSDEPPLTAVAPHPFADGFLGDRDWYFRPTLLAERRTAPEVNEILALLDEMRADLAVPFVARGVVFGWMLLRDDEWSDGFSSEEIDRLLDLADLVSVMLLNIEDFQALEQEHRLAVLGAMAAGLAHEIRNPLAGIKGAAQYLQSEALPEDAAEMLQVVLDETDRLNIVVSQFLDYARPFELKRSPDHINALVSHTLTLVRAQGLPPNIEMIEELAGDLPSLPLDRARLTQVLLNLLQNALQAMPDGGTLYVNTRRSVDRNQRPALEIAVTDTGVGIAPEHMANLFVPFFTTKDQGTGLGLAICQRIVQAHGGNVDVTSSVGQGSTFVIRLPLPLELDERPSYPGPIDA